MSYTWKFREENPFNLAQGLIDGTNAVNDVCCYVDSVNGNDANTGAWDSPFRTLPKAFNHYENIHYVVASGVFELTGSTLFATTHQKTLICEGNVIIKGNAQNIFIGYTMSVNSLRLFLGGGSLDSFWLGGSLSIENFNNISFTALQESVRCVHKNVNYKDILGITLGASFLNPPFMHYFDCTFENVVDANSYAILDGPAVGNCSFINSSLAIGNTYNMGRVHNCFFDTTSKVNYKSPTSVATARAKNNFYQGSITNKITIANVGYNDIEAVKVALPSFDTSSLPSATNPLLNEDFTLQINSPLITSGLDGKHIGAKRQAIMLIKDDFLNDLTLENIFLDVDKFKLSSGELKGSITTPLYDLGGVKLLKKLNGDFLTNLLNGGYLSNVFLDKDKPYYPRSIIEIGLHNNDLIELQTALNTEFPTTTPARYVRQKIELIAAYDDEAVLYLNAIEIPNNTTLINSNSISNNELFLAWNTFVIKCKISSLWAKLVDVYPFFHNSVWNTAKRDNAIITNAKNVNQSMILNYNTSTDFSLTNLGIQKDTNDNSAIFIDANKKLLSADQNNVAIGIYMSEDTGTPSATNIEVTNRIDENSGNGVIIKLNSSATFDAISRFNDNDNTQIILNEEIIGKQFLSLSRLNDESYRAIVRDFSNTNEIVKNQIINTNSTALIDANLTLFKYGNRYNVRKYGFYYRAVGLTEEEQILLGDYIKDFCKSIKR